MSFGSEKAVEEENIPIFISSHNIYVPLSCRTPIFHLAKLLRYICYLSQTLRRRNVIGDDELSDEEEKMI